MATETSCQMYQKVGFWHSIQNGRQTAILDRVNTIFGVYVPPMGIHGHAKFGNPSSSRSENFHQKVIPSTDDGLHTHSQRNTPPKWAKKTKSDDFNKQRWAPVSYRVFN